MFSSDHILLEMLSWWKGFVWRIQQSGSQRWKLLKMKKWSTQRAARFAAHNCITLPAVCSAKLIKILNTFKKKNLQPIASHWERMIGSMLHFKWLWLRDKTSQKDAFLQRYAISNQNIMTRATKRNSRDRKSSSVCWGVPGWAGGGLPSFMLKAVANIPKGKAPIPKDIWSPPSPKPNPWKPPRFSGSGLCPCGRGGVFSRGSCWPVLPLPYSGMTLSLLMPALHTGHTWLVGLVSNHWCKHGQQKRCPHRLMTASLAVSRQMLHSNVLSWLPPSAALLPQLEPGLGLSAAAAGDPAAGWGAAVAI